LDKELRVRDLSRLKERKEVINRSISDLIARLRKFQSHLGFLLEKEDIDGFILFSMARGVSRAVVEILGTYHTHYLHHHINFNKSMRESIGEFPTDFYYFHGYRLIYEIQFPKLPFFGFAWVLRNINEKLPKEKNAIVRKMEKYIRWLFFSPEYLLNYGIKTIMEVGKESDEKSNSQFNVLDGILPLSEEENAIIKAVKKLDEVLNELQLDMLKTASERIAGIAVSYLMFMAIKEVEKKLSSPDGFLELVELLVEKLKEFKEDTYRKLLSLIAAILIQVRFEEMKKNSKEIQFLDLDEDLFFPYSIEG
jgi:hypothetical protein